MALSRTSWALEQARIDEIIASVEKGVMREPESVDDLPTLRRRRNMLAPIVAQLPPELICRIISFYTLLSQDGPTRSMFYRWIKVTHAASYLRDVALAEPSLWTRISIPARDGVVEEFLRRSKFLPLDIWLGYHHTNSPGHILNTTVCNELPRVRSLSLLKPFEPAEWTSCFPQLTSLRHISLRYNYSYKRDSPPHFPHRVQLDTLDIEFNDCSFSWTPELFDSHITSLVIARNKGPASSQQLYDILSTLPRLQKLCLVGVRISGAWPCSKVTLPQLRELSLQDNNSLAFLGDFFASLSFPSCASISITHDGITTGNLQTQESEQSTQLLLNLIEHLTKLPASSLHSEPPPKIYSLSIRHQMKYGRFVLYVGNNWLKLHFRAIQSNARISNVLLSLIQILPLQHLMNLDLRGSEDSLCASIMPHLLSYAPSKIERLTITGTLTNAFLSHANTLISEAEVLGPSPDVEGQENGAWESLSVLDIVTSNPSCKELISSFPSTIRTIPTGPFSPSIFVPMLSLTLHMPSPFVVDKMSILVQDQDIRMI